MLSTSYMLIFISSLYWLSDSNLITYKFTRTANRDVRTVYDTFTLLNKFYSDLTTCLLQCNQNVSCYFVVYQTKPPSLCKLYRVTALLVLANATNTSSMYQKDMDIMKANTTGITSSFTATSSVVNGSNYQLAADRFNNANKSVFFNTGFVQVPEGVYFDGGDLTIIMWVKTTKVFWQSLIDFGSPNLTNNVIFQLDYSIQPNFQITVGTDSRWYSSNKALILNEWNHMVATLKGMSLTMYLNGIVAGQSTIIKKPLNLTRSTCYIGRSNWYYVDPSHNPDAIAYIDGIDFYDRALSADEVVADMMASLRG